MIASHPYAQSRAVMNTIVTVQLVGLNGTVAERAERDRLHARSLDWFGEVERICSRFDPASELCQLSRRVGDAVRVTPLLLHAVQFALAVAEESDGAFDPTIGRHMQRLGFAHDYRNGPVRSDVAALAYDDALDAPSWRDVSVDPEAQTITLARPLLLDLGAVAKGLAIDLAAQELASYAHFAIDAGGDLYLAGRNEDGGPWRVGIRHPRAVDAIFSTITISDRAVCTSGDYERTDPSGQYHLRDARTGTAANELASVTVVANSAMVADALATAAFALGPVYGRRLLERHSVDALFVTPELSQLTVGALVHD